MAVQWGILQPVQSQGFDPANTLMQVAQLKQMEQRNRLIDLQEKEANQKIEDRNKLRAAIPGAIQGDQAASAEVASINPELWGKIDQTRREKIKSETDAVGRLLYSVEQAPEAERPAAYAQARQIAQQSGLDISKVPETYNPTWTRAALARATDISQQIASAEAENNRRFQAAQQGRGFAHAKEMQGSQQTFTAAENEKGREHQTGLQANQQTFTAGQNDLSRTNQAALQANQQDFTAEENEKNRQLQINIKAADQKVAAAKTSAERENTLRDEWNTLTKPHRTVIDAYGKIQKSFASKTGPGDMSGLYSFIKLLDPDSAVREGEYATANNASSIPENIRRMYNKAIEGDLMDDAVRKKFLGEAQNIYTTQMQGYDTLAKSYGEIAGRYGVDAKNVIHDYRAKNEGDKSADADQIAALKSKYGITPTR
jgi:hypothetical protein